TAKAYGSAKTASCGGKREKERGATGPSRHALSLPSGWGGEHIRRLLRSPRSEQLLFFKLESPKCLLVYQDTSFDFTFLHSCSKLSTSYPPVQEKLVDKPLFARGGFLL